MAVDVKLSPPRQFLKLCGFLIDTILECDNSWTVEGNETELALGVLDLNFNLNAKEKAVIGILSRDRYLRDYGISARQLIPTRDHAVSRSGRLQCARGRRGRPPRPCHVPRRHPL